MLVGVFGECLKQTTNPTLQKNTSILTQRRFHFSEYFGIFVPNRWRKPTVLTCKCRLVAIQVCPTSIIGYWRAYLDLCIEGLECQPQELKIDFVSKHCIVECLQ